MDHDDAMPLTAFSVLAPSLIERTPESMGEDTVQSIREGGGASVEPESVTEVGADSKSTEAADSAKMSVTGRMIGDDAVCTIRGVEESSEGTWPESVGGGETVTGLVEERLDLSLTWGEPKGGSWESMTAGTGESLTGVDVESSTISILTGMSGCGEMEGGG